MTIQLREWEGSRYFCNRVDAMQGNINKNISDFFVAGINYKKTEAVVRGLFAVNTDQYKGLFPVAGKFGVDEFFVLSTCNRTEIYGFAESPEQLISLLCTQTTGDRDNFKSLAYIKRGFKAVEHMFDVGS